MVAYLALWSAALGLLFLALIVVPGWPRLAVAGAALNLFVIGLVVRRGGSTDRDSGADEPAGS